jgi:tetratricopeptide (TPR) repeat protein
VTTAPLALYINRDADYDWLIALAFGRVLDGQPDDQLVAVGDAFAWVLDHPKAAHVVGFAVDDLTEFDPEQHEALWAPNSPRFAAPTLGLDDASAGEVVIATRARYAHRSTPNRDLFDAAVATEGEDALHAWQECLATGDAMAHFGLGYTLVELDRHREAYAHLRFYTQLVPANGWAWCWLGQACEGIGSVDEARRAYATAVELEGDGGFSTDARERLEALRS